MMAGLKARNKLHIRLYREYRGEGAHRLTGCGLQLKNMAKKNSALRIG
jgi:hypothetical protein